MRLLSACPSLFQERWVIHRWTWEVTISAVVSDSVYHHGSSALTYPVIHGHPSASLALNRLLLLPTTHHARHDKGVCPKETSLTHGHVADPGTDRATASTRCSLVALFRELSMEAVPLENSSREKPMSMMEDHGEAAIACHHSSSSSLYTPTPGSTAMAMGMGAGEAPGLVFDYDSDPLDEAEPLHPQAVCECDCSCRRTCSPSAISCRPPNHPSSHLDTKIHSHPHWARSCPSHSNHFPFFLHSTYSYFSNLLSDLASRVGLSSTSSTSKVSSSVCHPISTSHTSYPHFRYAPRGSTLEGPIMRSDGPHRALLCSAGAFTGTGLYVTTQ